MGRNGHDVFVLGDENLVAEPDSTQDGGSVWVDEVRHRGTDSAEGHEAATSEGVRHRASSVPRRLAVLGLSVGAVAVFAASRLLTGGGDSPSPPSMRLSSVVSPAPLPTPVINKHAVAPSRRRGTVLIVHQSQRPRIGLGGGGALAARSCSAKPLLMRRKKQPCRGRSDHTVGTSNAARASPGPAPFTSPPVQSSLSSPPVGSGSGGGQEFGFER